jgi:DoxX-like family
MWTNSLPHLFAGVLAMIFAVAAIACMMASRTLREWFRDWGYPGEFYRVMGVLQFFAASFLAVAQLRIWGIILAGFISFFWIVTLLNHRQWSWAAAGMLMMMALVPASLAIY